MEETNQIQELNQTIQNGFSDISMEINSLKYSIENGGRGSGSGVLLIILIFVLVSINNNLKKLIQLNSSDKEWFLYYAIVRYHTLIPLINLLCLGGIGFVLGLDNDTVQFKKEGKLRFNIPKLIILVLPSLILSNSNILAKFTSSMNLIDSISIVSSIVYGHAFAGSIFKEWLANE